MRPSTTAVVRPPQQSITTATPKGHFHCMWHSGQPAPCSQNSMVASTGNTCMQQQHEIKHQYYSTALVKSLCATSQSPKFCHAWRTQHCPCCCCAAATLLHSQLALPPPLSLLLSSNCHPTHLRLAILSLANAASPQGTCSQLPASHTCPCCCAVILQIQPALPPTLHPLSTKSC
jgi:hypothetical protein